MSTHVSMHILACRRRLLQAERLKREVLAGREDVDADYLVGMAVSDRGDG